MKKWIVWVIVLITLIGAGAGAYVLFFRKKEDTTPTKPEAPEIPNTPREALDANAYLAQTTTSSSTRPASGTSEGVALVSVKSAQGRAAISKQAEMLENNSSLLNKIKARYEIGNRLFDGLKADAAEAIKISFEENIKGLDKNNFMEYPIFGTYSKPQLLQDLQNFIAQNPNGYNWNVKTIKLTDPRTPKLGYIPSISYNLVTGADRPSAGTEQEEKNFTLRNGITSATIAGMEIVKFARNWVAEIERLNKMIELEAINICLRNGWRFAEYTAPTTNELS